MTLLTPPPPRPDAAPHLRSCLAVALADRARALPAETAHVAGPRELTATLLALHRPEIVAVPLITAQVDALDLAERLLALGFQGALWVLAEGLPNPKLVEREIGRLCPGLTVRVAESFS